jgi:hypothetical protein
MKPVQNPWPDLDYPFHDKVVTVTTCGRICFNRQKINLSVVFAGRSVGIKQVSDEIWPVSFMDYDLGYFDHETCRLEPIANPFGPKVLPMSQEYSVTHVVGMDPTINGAPTVDEDGQYSFAVPL